VPHFRSDTAQVLLDVVRFNLNTNRAKQKMQDIGLNPSGPNACISFGLCLPSILEEEHVRDTTKKPQAPVSVRCGLGFPYGSATGR
jgi:hypothetical protein